MKNSIDALNSDAGLSAILKLNPVTFGYDKGFGDSGAAEQVGLIAEPTAAVNPLFAEYATAPMQTPNGTIEIGQPDGINWEAITSATVLAIQQQQASSTHSGERRDPREATNGNSICLPDFFWPVRRVQ